MNSSTEALRKAQAAFAGTAEELGLKNEDVADMVAELRCERMGLSMRVMLDTNVLLNGITA